MSLYAIFLVCGSLLGAFLVVHHLAQIKEDGDNLLATYRRLLADTRMRNVPPHSPPGAEAPEAK